MKNCVQHHQCPFCGNIVEVRTEVPGSDPYFSLHAIDGDTIVDAQTHGLMCEGSCISVAFPEFLPNGHGVCQRGAKAVTA
jgi:hypothetical protein